MSSDNESDDRSNGGGRSWEQHHDWGSSMSDYIGDGEDDEYEDYLGEGDGEEQQNVANFKWTNDVAKQRSY